MNNTDSLLKSEKGLGNLPMAVWEFVALLASIFALNAFAIDSMLPALDDIAQSYRLTDPNAQQNIIFAYVIGFGIPQLFYGPLSDRIGRRKILMSCIVGYVILALSCMFAPSFASLLIFRFFHGAFSAGLQVVGASIVRDLIKGREMAKVMSLVMTVFMVVPIIAPMAGQMVMNISTWSWIYGTLSIAGALVFTWIQFRLPETLPVEKRNESGILSVLASYVKVMTTRETVGYMLASGILTGALFSFIGASEQIFHDVFHRQDSFVYWFAGVGLSLAVATMGNSLFVERLGMRLISHTALIIFITSSLLNLLYAHFVGPNFIVFYVLFCLSYSCFGLVGSNFSAIAMEAQGDNAGTASAAYGFVTTTLSGFLGWIIAGLFDGTVRPILIGYVVLGAVSFTLVLITEKGILFERRKRHSS